MFISKWVALLTAFGLFFFSLNANSASPNYDKTREAGDVIGVVQICSQGISDAQVYVRGSSFIARTNSQGQFKISYMQEGVFDFVIRNESGIVGIIPQVQVLKKQTVDLGLHNFCLDLDGDGYTPPLDCDDANSSINPAATDVCGDGIDNDCSGAADEGCLVCTDVDLDGFYAQANCNTPLDCNDGNPAINPLATEVCDGVDNNCNGQTDETGSIGEQTYYYDYDRDGFGDPTNTRFGCSVPVDYVAQGGDCDDNDPTTNPAAQEIIGDGIDNDCNGITDEGSDLDADGHLSILHGGGDCNDTDPRVKPGQTNYFSSGSNHSPAYDYNCNGTEDKLDTQLADYTDSTVFFLEFCTVTQTGWKDTVPACGSTARYFNSTMSNASGTCDSNAHNKTQSCR